VAKKKGGSGCIVASLHVCQAKDAGDLRDITLTYLTKRWVIFAFLLVSIIIFSTFCPFFHQWPQHALCGLQVRFQIRQLFWFGHRVDSISLATGVTQKLPPRL